MWRVAQRGAFSRLVGSSTRWLPRTLGARLIPAVHLETALLLLPPIRSKFFPSVYESKKAEEGNTSPYCVSGCVTGSLTWG